MKVLMFLSNPFTHDPRVYNEARSLTSAGHEVVILAWDRTGSQPPREDVDGIKVIRVRNIGMMNIMPYDILRLNYWFKHAIKKSLELYKKFKFNMVHCHDQDTLPIGICLKKALGVKLVYDAHEVFGYMIARDIPQWWADRFLRKEREMAPKADHVITVAEPHLEHFKKMGCRNVTLVRNCKHLTENEYRPTNNKVFTLVYIGGLNRSRFLVEAAEVCKGINGMAFRVAGFGQAESELRLLADQNPGRIEFLGKIPMERVVPETQRGDVILCMFDPSNLNNKIGPPNKIFEAMVAGRPVIATKDTYSGGLVVENGMGLAVGFDKQGLKEALVELKDNPGVVQGMGKNALKAASGEFNWTVQENRLLNVYKTLGGSA